MHTLPSGAWLWCFADPTRLTPRSSTGGETFPLLGNIAKRGGYEVCTFESPYSMAVTAWLVLDHSTSAHGQK
jgi:hypothetical protein